MSPHATLGTRFATRLNAFGRAPLLDLAARAAAVDGLTDVDLNYPDHVDGDPALLARRLGEMGLAVNGLAMRFHANPAFRRGAFTNPDGAVRREAIELTRRGIDAARAMGADLMTLWLGQDGWETPFGADHSRLWADEVAGIAEVAGHDPACMVSVEYKPDEPRAFAVLSDVGTTLLALAEAGAPNTGVTLDFAHVLYAGETPAFAAALVARRSRLLGVHLNDGWGRRDDGLMVGSVNLLATVEFLHQIERDGYAGAIYFDTFPDASGLDPGAECAANIEATRRLLALSRRLGADNALRDAVAGQDAAAAHRIVGRALLGD